MKKNISVGVLSCAVLVAFGGGVTLVGQQQPTVESISPAGMVRVGTVDKRFQSYNIEMVEVIGGRFWKPYAKPGEAAAKAAPSSAAQSTNKNQPVGMDPNLYQYRPPIDLSNPRLRKLAAALGPAYVRVSGTWANSVYFQDSDGPAPATAPKGFGGVLTRQQWKGVIDFVHATDGELVTSFATSVGTRDASGVWTPDQAQKLLDYTKSIGGSIAAAEYMNEPTFAVIGGAPEGYDAANYGRDIKVFLPFIRKAAPEMVFLGPGGVGEGGSLLPAGMKVLASADLLKATGPVYDDFSYHFYGAVSKRCGGMGGVAQITPEEALSEDWLGRAASVEKFYAGLRDEYEPGKAMWLTETADAACGGNPWASTFLDSFRYLDQHGQLAKMGVQVVMHNTLASSDYGLLDENTLAPRPNYWAALLWHRLMGTTVLDAGSSPAANLHLYAQCLQGHPGGVALLAINADREAAQELSVPVRSERYTLTAAKLMDTAVELNGKTLTVDAEGDVPSLTGTKEKAGRVMLAPESITFLAMPKAGNQSCR